MKPSKLDTNQLRKVAKAALYLAISGAISGVLTAITGNPLLFGVFTPIVNVVLVVLKQLFTPSEV